MLTFLAKQESQAPAGAPAPNPRAGRRFTPPGAPGEVGLETLDVAQGGRHQDELDLIRAFYADKGGIHPERRTEPRLREEATGDRPA